MKFKSISFNKSIKEFAIFTLILLAPLDLMAVNAIPTPVIKTLPDGSTITVYLHGNEFFRYRTNREGYMIQRDSLGFYQYARFNANFQSELSGIRAHDAAQRNASEIQYLASTSSALLPDSIRLQSKMQKAAAVISLESSLQNNFPKFGSPHSLVILVNFSDTKFTVSNPKTSFTNLLNQSGYSNNGGTGSARDYFVASSSGNSSPHFDVVGPYDLNQKESYYGANDATSGDDKNPRQMIIDACKLADADVNFADYDVDGDGYVDNVFVYFAGYNEAEGADENTIWPHRWALSPSLTLDGKKIYGYACTSELNYILKTMCGVGTFCHEFGHVYGLADYYSTSSTTNQTLDFWNIMDSGNYLNNGRTPPTYSAYDRFFLGWLTPNVLSQPISLDLPPLTDSNTAFMITQSGSSNLLGSAPSPSEFFMLENRQKKGWDLYLPGHGMLITRIKYNSTAWANNEVNSQDGLMYVDLMEADNKAGGNTFAAYAGDPYPGTSNIHKFTPVLLDGTSLSTRSVSNILESSGNITFSFMGGGSAPMLTASSATLPAFSAEFHNHSESKFLDISGSNLQSNVLVSLRKGSNFKIRPEGTSDENWNDSAILIPSNGTLSATTLEIQYIPQIPSYIDLHRDTLIIESSNAFDKVVSVSGLTSSANTTLFTGKTQKLRVYQDQSGSVMIDMKDLDKVDDLYRIRVINMMGQVLYSKETNDNFLEVSSLPHARILIVEVNGLVQRIIR